MTPSLSPVGLVVDCLLMIDFFMAEMSETEAALATRAREATASVGKSILKKGVG